MHIESTKDVDHSIAIKQMIEINLMLFSQPPILKPFR